MSNRKEWRPFAQCAKWRIFLASMLYGSFLHVTCQNLLHMLLESCAHCGETHV